jgi:hypothetical protein
MAGMWRVTAVAVARRDPAAMMTDLEGLVEEVRRDLAS